MYISIVLFLIEVYVLLFQDAVQDPTLHFFIVSSCQSMTVSQLYLFLLMI